MEENMNQILVSEKLYVTPELKRKKKIYQFAFLISIICVCLLSSYYIYAEYDRTKSEEVSQEILAEIDNTTINQDDGILRVALEADTQEQNVEIQETESNKYYSIRSNIYNRSSIKYTITRNKLSRTIRYIRRTIKNFFK